MNLNLLLKILLLFLLVKTAHSQEANWVIEPVIEGVDEINPRWANYGLILITVDEKEGMINLENELRAPPVYKFAGVDFDGKVINAVKEDASNDFYSLSGKTISKEQYREIRRKHWEKNGSTESSDVHKAFLKLKPKVKLELVEDFKYRSKHFYKLFSPTNELLAERLNFKKHIIYMNKFMAAYDDASKRHLVVDIYTGEVVHRGSGQQIKTSTSEQDYFIIRNDEVANLFSPKGKFIGEFEKFTFCENESYGIGVKNGKAGLYQLKSMKQIGELVNNIYDKSPFMVYEFSNKTAIYNTNNKKFIEIPYACKEYQKLEYQNHLILQEEDRLGLWDIKEESWIIKPEFATLVNTPFNHYIAKREKQLKRYSHMTLFDSKGKMVYDEENLGIYCYYKLFKVTEPNRSTTLRSYKKEELKSFSKDYTITSNGERNMLTVINEKARSSDTYHTTNFIEKEFPKFDKIKQTIKSLKEPGKFWYIIMKDNLLGIIDYQGREILPTLYEKIDIDEFVKGYINVIKDKKWGVLAHP